MAIWAPTSRLGDHSHDSDLKYGQKCEIRPFLASEYAPTNVLRVVRTPIKTLPAVRDGTKAKRDGIVSVKTFGFRRILLVNKIKSGKRLILGVLELVGALS